MSESRGLALTAMLVLMMVIYYFAMIPLAEWIMKTWNEWKDK